MKPSDVKHEWNGHAHIYVCPVVTLSSPSKLTFAQLLWKWNAAMDFAVSILEEGDKLEPEDSEKYFEAVKLI
jgi:hypothetical protein